MADTLLLDELFTVTSVDSERYDRVSRITADSSSMPSVHMTLDINSEIYPLREGETVSTQITSTLALDGSKDTKAWRESRPGERTLADDYEYVCYGKVYRFDEGKDDNIQAYISFGGLLLCLEGSHRKLTSLKQDNVYLLMRR